MKATGCYAVGNWSYRWRPVDRRNTRVIVAARSRSSGYQTGVVARDDGRRWRSAVREDVHDWVSGESARSIPSAGLARWIPECPTILTPGPTSPAQPASACGDACKFRRSLLAGRPASRARAADPAWAGHHWQVRLPGDPRHHLAHLRPRRHAVRAAPRSSPLASTSSTGATGPRPGRMRTRGLPGRTGGSPTSTSGSARTTSSSPSGGLPRGTSGPSPALSASFGPLGVSTTFLCSRSRPSGTADHILLAQVRVRAGRIASRTPHRSDCAKTLIYGRSFALSTVGRGGAVAAGVGVGPAVVHLYE